MAGFGFDAGAGDLLENVTIPVEVTGAYKKYLNGVVEKEGVSLNSFITDAIGEKIDRLDGEPMQEGVLANLIEWLRTHGNTDTEILDCIAYLGKE
ncbi:MAG: hypothetical protein E7222_09895 [Clostridiales bacterium]|nr:hypothetical protein [Clostridiales bacterium]